MGHQLPGLIRGLEKFLQGRRGNVMVFRRKNNKVTFMRIMTTQNNRRSLRREEARHIRNAHGGDLQTSRLL